MKFNIKIEKEVEATIVQVRGKISDCCSYTLTDGKGNEIIESDGYIPGWLSDAMDKDGDTDHLFFDIDLKTGQIIGWVPPLDHELESWVKDVQEE